MWWYIVVVAYMTKSRSGDGVGAGVDTRAGVRLGSLAGARTRIGAGSGADTGTGDGACIGESSNLKPVHIQEIVRMTR